MVFQKALDSPNSYAIAWIAALPIERAAAGAMLDEEHATPITFKRHQADANAYTWGRVGEHNIVIASLASGVYGTTSAATTASNMLASLPSIRVGLLVGIGGGIARPDKGQDIRLGDVVVSQPRGTTSGICQYDLIKAKADGTRERKGFLGRPPMVLLNALSSIQANHERKDSKIPCFLQKMLKENPKMSKISKQNPGYIHQGFENDRLFKASCGHIPGPNCRGCGTAGEVQRDPRDSTDPVLHYGTIASGNTLVKDAAARDRIVAEMGEDCVCFEMEAAGLMNHFPCLVIRGICDYADSHKNDRWQRYASATAAAYAKELLAHVPVVEVQRTKRALEVLQLVKQQIDDLQQKAVATKAATDFISFDIRTEKIKHWLRPPDSSTNANHARMLRHEGTGTWLFRSPVFLSWYSGLRQHLWLHGLAGCGKTILSAAVLDHLAKKNDGLILSFFFDFSDTTKQTLNGMLRSLAFQLHQGGASSPTRLDALAQAHQDGSQQPSTSALSDTLSKMLEAQRRVYIVLDAIDESKTRNDIVLWIEHAMSKPELVHVQLLYTSRPESEFLRHFPRLIGQQNCLPLDKNAVNSDIRSWVSAQLSQRRDFTDKPLSRELVEEIRRRIGDGADGMFRWAFCQLDSLARCRHTAAMEEVLTSLPLDLYETYRRMIEGIPKKLKRDAIRLLQFLVHCKQPLKLKEANEIIATQIENESQGFDIRRRLFYETDVLDYCPSLVTVIDAFDKELHLAHFSVKEFLLGEDCFEIQTASISITKTCLKYLTDIEGDEEAIGLQFPMARLAAKLWTGHATLAQHSDDIVQMSVKFLETEATFQRWAHLYQDRQVWDIDPTGSRLYYACFAGLTAPARVLIGKGADVNAQGGYYGNALQVASSQGHRDVVELLLYKEADVNAQGGHYGNALRAASQYGSEEIVALLLDWGANVNAWGGDHSSALYTASSEGHQEVTKLLLDSGADVNAQGSYSSALYAASSKGYQEIVRLLLDRGADINAQGGHYGNALQVASSEGHQEVVKLLLDNKADLNMQGGFHGNALRAASFCGHRETVHLLLDSGADVNAQQGLYSNALYTASSLRHQEVAKLLLDRGADVNAQGGIHKNALQVASFYGRRGIVQLLLDRGADVNAQGGLHSNALQAASSQGHQEVVKLLLDRGADVNAQGGLHSNALQAASSQGHQEVVKLLLDRGADVNVQGDDYLQISSSRLIRRPL
ncbi:Pfs NACHT and Ankyrin domain protein [Penicillium sp. IBT 35674x]|nr:Pfs NACHT and Ankyrin domain protein [Penicillium sp. IBT 35674x]